MSKTEDLLSHMRLSGGVSSIGRMTAASSRHTVRRAVHSGRLVRTGFGVYALPQADEARQAAARASGVAWQRSAAAHWGWAMKTQPDRPMIAVPRSRKVSREVQSEFSISWRAIPAPAVEDGWVTSPVRTVLDCATTLPLDEALAIADSALRSRRVTRDQLERAALELHRGRARALEVLRAASAEAANPFESVLRAIAMDVSGLSLRPQRPIREGGFFARPDLVDESLRIVLEADSHEFHSTRAALVRDCARYDNLVAHDWLVLRFAWEQVMSEPDWVRRCIAAVARLRQRQQRGRQCRAKVSPAHALAS